MAVPQTVQCGIIADTAVLLLGMYARDIKTHLNTETCTRIFMAVQRVIARMWRGPQNVLPLTNRKIKRGPRTRIPRTSFSYEKKRRTDSSRDVDAPRGQTQSTPRRVGPGVRNAPNEPGNSRRQEAAQPGGAEAGEDGERRPPPGPRFLSRATTMFWD